MDFPERYRTHAIPFFVITAIIIALMALGLAFYLEANLLPGTYITYWLSPAVAIIVFLVLYFRNRNHVLLLENVEAFHASLPDARGNAFSQEDDIVLLNHAKLNLFIDPQNRGATNVQK